MSDMPGLELCEAKARSATGASPLFCWLKSFHEGDHYDRDFGIYWHRKAGRPAAMPPMPKPLYRRRWRRRREPADADLAA